MVYLDTSSLVKLQVKEDGSHKVSAEISNASAVFTSIVAYAESRAAFARQYRDRQLTKKEFSSVKNIFDVDWKRFIIIGINQEISCLAGDLAEKYALRGFDSIHLASFLSAKKKTAQVIHFSSFDERLNNAASRLKCL